jgi:hypothetical protein
LFFHYNRIRLMNRFKVEQNRGSQMAAPKQHYARPG